MTSLDNIMSDNEFLQAQCLYIQNKTPLHQLLSAKELLFADYIYNAFDAYYADLPYHNKAHHKTVANFAVIIADTLGKNDLIEPLILSAGTHDIGYDVDYLAQGMPKERTKEDYAIFLLQEKSKELHLDLGLLALAKDGIEGTKIHMTDFGSDMRKIMRAADIRLLGCDYSILKKNTLRIKEEYEILYGTQVSIGGFIEKQIEILQLFCTVEHQLAIPEEYYAMSDGVSFYENLENNIARLEQEYL